MLTNTILKKLSVVFLLVVIFLPVITFAASNLPIVQPCTGGAPPGGGEPECTFTDLLNMVNRIVSFLLFDVAAPLAVLVMAYAGFLYITAAGDSGKIGKAHDIFKNVIIGMIIAFAAFLIVKAILTGLGVGSNGGNYNQFLLEQ